MSGSVKLDTRYLEGFVSNDDIRKISPRVEKARDLLMKRNGPGNDFLGWVDLPGKTGEELIKDVESTAERLRCDSDVIIVIGIGGSYLGAKAAIDMLTPGLGPAKVIFSGCDLSGDRLKEVLSLIREKETSVNVISKSGTTTEPAIAFRLIREELLKKYGPEKLKKKIVCTTDQKKGALRTLADRCGYKTFVIPDDVGGRFSVFTPVGLLPIACAGISIRNLLAGARQSFEETRSADLEKNLSYKYAALRNILYEKGKLIEIMSDMDPAFHYVSEWWKQLFGESEGKDGKGIFPASCDFTTDLHSLGQFIQAGARNIFETFVIEERNRTDCPIPRSDDDTDNLNYLAGKQVSYVNDAAYRAVSHAHFEGGVPNMTVSIPEKSAHCLGQLFYFFETSAAVSAYILGVNPFDQPGVESYKKKMFALLGKPGTK